MDIPVQQLFFANDPYCHLEIASGATFFANDFDHPLRQSSHVGILTLDETIVPDRHLCKRMATENDPDYLQKR